MEREEFIKSLGLGLVMVCAGSCLTSCSKSGGDVAQKGGGSSPQTSVTADLTLVLKNIGDQIVIQANAPINPVLIFRIGKDNTPSSFVATQALCPHEGGNLVWEQSNNFIQCQEHFSEYKEDGSVLQQPQNVPPGDPTTTNPLVIHTVSVSGTTLTASTTAAA